jgi:AcrR family transcriptional regulator
MPRLRPEDAVSHSTAVRERILVARSDLLCTREYTAITVADVGARAGLARSSVYRYFPDKEQLLFASIDRHLSFLLDEIHAQIASNSDPETLLRIFVAVLLEAYRQLPVASPMELAPELSSSGRARLDEAYRPVYQVLNVIIERARPRVSSGSSVTLTLSDS